LKDGDPNGRNVAAADGARLADDGLLLTHFPSTSRLIDTGGAAGIEVGPGIGVLVGEAISIRGVRLALVGTGGHMYMTRYSWEVSVP
jgi:hypothetical protein